MLDPPEMLMTNEQRTAVIHITVPRTDIQSVMETAIREILTTMTVQGVHPAGPLFSYHLKRPTDIFDFEVGFPVKTEITPDGRVKSSKLPAAKAVRTIYHGGYEGLGAAWGELFQWIKTKGLNAQGSLWECYISGTETNPDPATWATELNAPI